MNTGNSGAQFGRGLRYGVQGSYLRHHPLMHTIVNYLEWVIIGGAVIGLALVLVSLLRRGGQPASGDFLARSRTLLRQYTPRRPAPQSVASLDDSLYQRRPD